MADCVVPGGQGGGGSGGMPPMSAQAQKAPPGPPSVAQLGMLAAMLSTPEARCGSWTPLRAKPAYGGMPQVPLTPML